MLCRRDLLSIAKTRLAEARVLLAAGKYDGAFYLCGYVIECALKARVVATLRWAGFPETGKEFDHLNSFKNHYLETLLKFSGREAKILLQSFSDWKLVEKWRPELRYQRIGTVGVQDATSMMNATIRLFRVI